MPPVSTSIHQYPPAMVDQRSWADHTFSAQTARSRQSANVPATNRGNCSGSRTVKTPLALTTENDVLNLLNEVCFTIEPHIEGHIESVHVVGPGIRCFLLKVYQVTEVPTVEV